MALTIEAIYENGVLKPAQPLPLKEHETVRITIEPQGGGGEIQVHAASDWVSRNGRDDPVDRRPRDAPAPGRRCRVRSQGAGMTFADLIAGEAIFLDANPFGNGRYAEGVAQHSPGSQRTLGMSAAGHLPSPNGVPQCRHALWNPVGVSLGWGDRDPGLASATLGFAVQRLRRTEW